jgi:hypothetical protein
MKQVPISRFSKYSYLRFFSVGSKLSRINTFTEVALVVLNI